MRQVLEPGALGRPRGIGWRGRWEGELGWGIHVYAWLIHVNVWRKWLQCCGVISLQLIQKKLKKKWMNCSQFYLICHIQPDLLPTDCHFLKHIPSTTFAGKTLLQTVGGRKCFPRVCEIPKPGFLHTGINKCISHWQKCVDCNDPIFSNKDVWAYLLICWFNSHSLKSVLFIYQFVLLWLITISI